VTALPTDRRSAGTPWPAFLSSNLHMLGAAALRGAFSLRPRPCDGQIWRHGFARPRRRGDRIGGPDADETNCWPASGGRSHWRPAASTRRRVFPNEPPSRPSAVASESGQNPPPALQKIPRHHPIVSAYRAAGRKFTGVYGTRVVRCLAVKQIILTESCPKDGDVPRSPLPENGSLMPSAGTISTWKSTLIHISGAIGIGILR
jgi:hypothetical protein